ncbi:PREDICTED: neutrophil defensin 4-like [Colobus angolensis palliatus]|uniref:neutrophil defensin 4-like n=1 Tax=Colobus angolensis palliatus TaxID=336983 RepID=UPI0005F57DAA|nr:PREDICTED: neutrophil defensin 4-like [Colobus angolensis palliatus]
MRTLAILAAILLVALQAQAESLQETADDTATQEQPGEEDQDLAVSFEENGLSTLRPSGSQVTSAMRILTLFAAILLVPLQAPA